MLKKINLWRVLGILLIVGGLIMLAIPFLSDQKIQKQVTQQVETFQTVSAEELAENKESSEAVYDFEAITMIDPTQTLLDPSAIDPSLMIGELTIPSIDTELIIFKGVTNDIMNAGVGTMRPDQSMGEGNYPLAGHWAQNPDLLLARLGEMKIGDDIYITNKKDVYHYVVYDSKIVHETEVFWIEDQISLDRGKPIVSLMNCFWNDAGYWDRLFVFGELVNVFPYEDFQY